MIRLVVVDDHPIVRQGLVASLEDEADFEVAAAAGPTPVGQLAAEQLGPLAHPDQPVPIF